MSDDWQAVLRGERQWAVLEADCIDVLADMPDGCVDAVVTDPPYGIGDAVMRMGPRGGRRRGDNTWHPPSDWDKSIDPRWPQQCGRVAPVTVWFGHWRKREEVESAHPHKLRCEIIWAKDMHCGPPCPVARRDERIWVFSASGMTRPFETSVWDEPVIPTWSRREHKNEKPPGLMRRLVSWAVDTGCLILDPFAGSGTTGVAALRTGRRVILIEREPKYAALCRERLEAEDEGTTVQAKRAGQLSLLGSAK